MSDEVENPNQPSIQEPSVLDYVKSLFRFGEAARIRIPEFVEEAHELESDEFVIQESEELQGYPKPSTLSFQLFETPFPWRSLLALFLALIAQRTFEPPHEGTPLGIALYIIAFSFLEIGRASCRERVYISVVAVSLKK